MSELPLKGQRGGRDEVDQEERREMGYRWGGLRARINVFFHLFYLLFMLNQFYSYERRRRQMGASGVSVILP